MNTLKGGLKETFGKNNKIIIGAIHLPSLLECVRIETFASTMVNDLEALETGGVNAVIFENNYDSPHTEFVSDHVAAMMLEAGKILKAKTALPIGISVLWNDYKTALNISKVLGLKFIRVPAFVDTVETAYGIMPARAEEITEYRKKISADNVMLFTDIHVKHSKPVSSHSLEDSARLAIENGSSAIIITGKWTGHAPNMSKLQSLRSYVGDFPIFIGSGADKSNIADLLKYANGAIVSTSLKSGSPDNREINVKPYRARIDALKVQEFMVSVTSGEGKDKI